MTMDLAQQNFDVYQRFLAIQRILVALGLKKDMIVLDVGGHPGTLADSLADAIPEVRIVTLDRPLCRRENYIRGSADAVPFSNNAFDAVVSSDTLEHLPVDARNTAINEALRVSRRWVIIGAPFRSPSVEFAEEKINTLHKKCLGKPNPWLTEHIKNILPEIEVVRGALLSSGAAVRTFPNGAVVSWFIMEATLLLMETFPMLSRLNPALNQHFNALWAAGDDGEPAYRHILVADKTGEEPPDIPAISINPPADEDAAMKKLYALYELADQAAEQILTLLADPKQHKELITTRYIRQLEEVIHYQEEEQKRLRANIARQEEYLTKVRTSPFFRLLRKLKFL